MMLLKQVLQYRVLTGIGEYSYGFVTFHDVPALMAQQPDLRY